MVTAAQVTLGKIGVWNGQATVRSAAGSLPAGTYMTAIQTLSSLLALKQDWIELAQNVTSPAALFQSFEWIESWCKTNITAEGPNQLLVYTGYRANRLVFVWPMMRNNRHGLRTGEWLTSPSGQYGDILLADGEVAEPWMQAALAQLRQSGAVDLLRLRHVRAQSAFASFAAAHFSNANSPERAPYMDLGAFANAGQYEERYTSAQRKRRKKIRKELEAFGPVTFRKLTPGAETDAAIDAALDHKVAWLKERGRMNRILGCPHHRNFLKDLARNPSNGMTTVVSEISTGGKGISWEIGFRFKSTHYAYITSHDTAMTDHSPGRLHMHYSQLQCIEDGIARFDLMVPYDAHKESWSSGMIDTDDFYLPLTARGLLHGTAYLKVIRPLARKIYYKLPSSILRLMSPLTCGL